MESALDLGNRYLDKHRALAQEFGLGPHLDKHEIELYGSPRVGYEGSLLIQWNNEFSIDCSGRAKRLYLDILSNNPEYHPRLVYYDRGDRHVWVEITDPQTKKVVQIDPSPWYSKLNPGHRGREVENYDRATNETIISIELGVPFSVTPVGDRFISTYLFGFLPMVMLPEEFVKSQMGKIPHYKFHLQMILSEGFNGTVEKFATIYLDVQDSELLEKFCKASLEDLIQNGVITVGKRVFAERKRFIDTQFRSIGDLMEGTMMRNISHEKWFGHKPEEVKDLMEEARRNIPRIARVMSKVKSVLPIHKDPTGSRIDTRTGRMVR